MKKNTFILIVITMLSIFTSLLSGGTSNLNSFFLSFAICFFFWTCMFAPAFELK